MPEAPSIPAPPALSVSSVPLSAVGSAGPPIGPGVTIDRGYGRIVVDQRIGEGGMGIVWRGWLFYPPAPPPARGSQPPSPIALKVLRPQASVREEVRQFFLVEAEALSKLSHPNVVRFHELFEWFSVNGESLVLAMEYVDGDTLEDVIARHVARSKLAGGTGALPGMPFQRAWYYFQQLLGALAATHALGVVHRDVKPSNILVRRDGIVKLTDFGIARLTRRGAFFGSGPDESELAPGTGAYMSPEQVLAKPLDGRSDLYSAATVLYEMLCGRTPFSTDNKSEFMVRQEQVHAQPPPLRTYMIQAPPILDALFARALAKDPSMRFESAIEMGTAFRDALGLPDTAEWRAQADIANAAKAFSPTAPDSSAAAAQDQKLGTLRDFLVKRYTTMSMSL
jgi:serine/threonine-protein kinase